MAAGKPDRNAKGTPAPARLQSGGQRTRSQSAPSKKNILIKGIYLLIYNKYLLYLQHHFLKLNDYGIKNQFQADA